MEKDPAKAPPPELQSVVARQKSALCSPKPPIEEPEPPIWLDPAFRVGYDDTTLGEAD